VISPAELEAKLEAFVQLEGLAPDRERVVLAGVKAIAPAIHRLIRGEVLSARLDKPARTE
jgi:hypothetical protein